MLARSLALILPAVALVSLPTWVALAPAQDAPAATQPQQVRFIGQVNTDGAFVRSGPAESDYAVMRLDRGTELTVVGTRLDQLMILPPRGAFCLVPQAFIERRGDGTVGTVGQQPATVRIGSSITPQKHRVPLRLDPGATVQIIGTLDEFYQVVPPEGVYLFVDKRFVDPLRRADDPANANVAPAPATVVATTTTAPGVAPTAASEQPAPTVIAANTAAPTITAPVAATGNPAVTEITAGAIPETTPVTAATPTAQQVVVSVPIAPAEPAGPSPEELARRERLKSMLDRFDAVEARFAQAAGQSIIEQPVAELLAEYRSLVADAEFPPNARRVADVRIQTLTIRNDVLTDYLAAREAQQRIGTRNTDLLAEQAELERRIADGPVQFTALGRLTTSSLQIGGTPLYRLVDPGTSRTMLYVRSAGAQAPNLLDQFVGIDGTVSFDSNIRLTVLDPKTIQMVEPSMVNVKIFADRTPPSMGGSIRTADGQGTATIP